MDIQTLEQLGISKDDLQQKVVDKIVSDLMNCSDYDEDGDICESRSKFAVELRGLIQNQIKSSVAATAAQCVLPQVHELVSAAVIRKTNRYGEQTGEPETFTSFLLKTAQTWLTECVDASGKRESDFNYRDQFKPIGTRIQIECRRHVSEVFSKELAEQFCRIQQQIRDGLQEAVAIKLQQLEASLAAPKK